MRYGICLIPEMRHGLLGLSLEEVREDGACSRYQHQTCSCTAMGAGVGTKSLRRKSVSARIGKMRTDSSPAAISAAPVAFVIKASSMPIWDAATRNESDAACN